MNKKAWTMAELAVSMVVLIVLSYISVSAMKTNTNHQAKIFLYATMKNLAYANGRISDERGEFYPEDANESSGDWYCKNLVDTFTLKNSPNCSSESTYFQFANGVTIDGLARAWSAPYKYKSSSCVSNCVETPDFWYKNIMIDTNGRSKAPNKIGVDRFPMRLYRGYNSSGTNLAGMVYPACGTYDYVYNPTGTQVKMETGSYCETNSNFIEESELISYNIYRVDQTLSEMKDWSSGKMKDKEVGATLILGQQSFMKADCLAYGGNGFFNKLQCNAAGYKLHELCANYDICKDCKGSMHGTSYNVCPASYNSVLTCQTQAAALNPVAAGEHRPDQSCFIMMNRPMSGLGFLGGALLGDIDM